MTQERLTVALRDQDIQRKVLNGYWGSYSLGVAGEENNCHITLRVDTTTTNEFPDVLDIDGEPVRIDVKSKMGGIRPL